MLRIAHGPSAAARSPVVTKSLYGDSARASGSDSVSDSDRASGSDCVSDSGSDSDSGGESGSDSDSVTDSLFE